VTPSELPFSEIWLHDFEFIAKPGCYPDVVCLAARELRSGQTLSLWLEPGERPPVPYRTDFDSLFVSFVASAELSCHLALGWPLPVKVLDLNPEFRRIMNGRPGAESRGPDRRPRPLPHRQHRRQAKGGDAEAHLTGATLYPGGARAVPPVLHV